MRFDLEWLRDQLEGAPDADALAAGLTGCGLLVEVREPAGASEVWDVDVTTNRPDAMNHRGLAREAAVATGARLAPLELALDEAGESTADLVGIGIDAPAACRRFCGRVVRGVKMGPSPAWLRERLERCGVRPIGVVVDVTNYVMLTLGQPLHAYDLARVAGPRLVARMAREGERLVTLDGETRELDPSMAVIADDGGAVGLAGVMGGAATEIGDGTTDVLLEAASFDPVTVRRMARRLGMHTEASHRFERGADPELPPVAIDLAAAMIAELAGGSVCRGRIDVHPRPREPVGVGLSLAALSAFAGLELEADEVLAILAGLGFAPAADGDVVRCTVPSHRVDVERAADLYEEVLRHVGYGRVPARLPVLSTSPGRRHPSWRRTDRARDAAVAAGLVEVMTYSFIADDDDRPAEELPWPVGEPLRLDNPLTRTQSTMRRSLLPGLVAATRDTLNQGEETVAAFEVGRVFRRTGEGVPAEGERLAVVMAGASTAWLEPAVDFRCLRGRVEAVADLAGLGPLRWRRGGGPWLDEGEGAVLQAEDGSVAGFAGLLSAAMAERWGLRQPLYLAELDLDRAADPAPPRFVALPRHPAVTVDLTVEHAVDMAHGALEESLRELAERRVERIWLKDRFAGPGVAAGRVRSTFRLRYRDPERSLTQDEVNRWQEALRSALVERLGVTLI